MSQFSLHLDISSYLTYQEGTIFGLGYEYQQSQNEWIVGLHYVSIGDEKTGPDFVSDGSRSAKGYGLKLEYNRVFTTDKNGMFLGVRTDVQFNSYTERRVLSFPRNIYKYSSTVIQPTFQMGYQFSIKDKIDLKLYFSTGVNKNSSNSGLGSVSLLGIRFEKVIN